MGFLGPELADVVFVVGKRTAVDTCTVHVLLATHVHCTSIDCWVCCVYIAC